MADVDAARPSTISQASLKAKSSRKLKKARPDRHLPLEEKLYDAFRDTTAALTGLGVTVGGMHLLLGPSKKSKKEVRDYFKYYEMKVKERMRYLKERKRILVDFEKEISSLENELETASTDYTVALSNINVDIEKVNIEQTKLIRSVSSN